MKNGTVTGTIFDIKHFAVHDGPGIRTTVFFKGCPLECWWCHNPESQSAEIEAVDVPVKWSDGTTFTERQTIGREVSVADVMKELDKDSIFYDESGGGVTFSGGEPLSQSEFLEQLLAACKRHAYHTALDTSGYAPAELLQRIAGQVDLFLYDLKLMDDEQHRKYTGVSNRLILENLAMLAGMNAAVILRFPVVPGITDSDDNVTELCDFVSGLKGINRISLLPYHSIADGKYRKLKKTPRIDTNLRLPKERLAAIKKKCEQNGLIVTTGG